MTHLTLAQRRRAYEIGKIWTHEMRLEILEALSTGERMSAVDFSRLTGCALGNASHHMNTLRDVEAIEEVETIPVRGTLQHLFEITKFGREARNVAEAL